MKNNTFRWNRRLFIGGAAGVAITSVYLGAVTRGVLKACENVHPVLLSGDLESLIRIGSSYLNEHTQNHAFRSRGEPKLNLLLLNILDEPWLDETEMRLANIVHSRLLAINHYVRDEFARCETVICDGWVLSRSEAQFCAIIAAHASRFHG